MSDINGMYGRTEADGTISVWSMATGAAVTFMPADVKPVGSELSARKNHPLGIKLTRKDALAIGLEIRGAAPPPKAVPAKAAKPLPAKPVPPLDKSTMAKAPDFTGQPFQGQAQRAYDPFSPPSPNKSSKR